MQNVSTLHLSCFPWLRHAAAGQRSKMLPLSFYGGSVVASYSALLACLLLSTLSLLLPLSQSLQSIFNICKHIRHEQTNVDNILIWLPGYCPEIIWERRFSKAAHMKGKVTEIIQLKEKLTKKENSAFIYFVLHFKTSLHLLKLLGRML